jgi:hypothetical protein
MIMGISTLAQVFGLAIGVVIEERFEVRGFAFLQASTEAGAIGWIFEE